MTEEETEEIEQPVINLYRLTRPTTLGKFAMRIDELRRMVNSPDIIYEGLFTYFLTTVQQSEYLIPKTIKPLREFTLVTRDEIPIGFAHWYVKPAPLYMAAARTDFVYLWADKDDKAFEALMGRFIAFGRRHKCEFYQVDFYNQINADKTRQIFEEKKLTFKVKENPAFFAQEIKKK